MENVDESGYCFFSEFSAQWLQLIPEYCDMNFVVILCSQQKNQRRCVFVYVLAFMSKMGREHII